MNDAIQIIDATPEDASGIQIVQRETWLNSYPNSELGITKEDLEAKMNNNLEERTERRVKRIREDQSTHIWVAKNKERVIGFIEVVKLEEMNKIGALYILPEYQRRELGKQLMKKALDWLGSEKKISLEVVTYNQKAIDFYKSFEFVENGETINEAAKLPSGKVLPEIRMIRN
jgi:ribosomal protein S18 acetylase RimI-like enzyme